MKRCFLLVFAVSLGWSQTSTTTQLPTPPPTPGNTGAAASGLKLRGSDVMAETDPNRVVAIIHGDKITAADAQKLLKRLPPEQAVRITTPEQKQKAVENVYLATKLAEEGEKLKLADTSPWKEQLDNYRISLLANAYVQHLAQQNYTPADTDISKYYADHPLEYQQVKLAVIYISYTPAGAPTPTNPPAGVTPRTQAEAKAKATEVVTRARAPGGDFASIATMNSDDKNSAAKGGDVGTISAGKNSFPKELAEVLAKMNKGDITDPIDMKNGYYILHANDIIHQTLDEVKPQIAETLKADHTKAVVQNTVSEYKIQVQDSDFFATAKPAGTVQPPTKTPSLQSPPNH
jgi:PPIC-type PPIASE domain